jgi:hypothetical protein
MRGGHCVLPYITRGGREDITPRITSDNTFIGRNVYTTAKQGAKATLVYLLSGIAIPQPLTYMAILYLATVYRERSDNSIREHSFRGVISGLFCTVHRWESIFLNIKFLITGFGLAKEC